MELPADDSAIPVTGGKADSARASDAPHVLIIVQNLPVPFDRRVRLECKALVDRGYRVSVVCPKGPGDPRFQVVDGVEIHKYRPYPPTQRRVGFVAEYLWSFTMTAWLTLKVWRQSRFDALQACNPPDIFWPLARLFRRMGGVRFVYDQHDLCPELYQSRFPNGSRYLYRGLRFLEGQTFGAADHVVSTNDSYRSIALGRGAKRGDHVSVVRTGPDPDWLQRREPDPLRKRGHRYLACYLGVMGPQDGVDVVLRAAAVIVHEMGRRDIAFTLIGSGDCFDELVALARTLEVDDVVEFTGRAPDEVVFDVLSSADVGLSPDPKNPLNDVSTMNKTMEYMAFELPVVAFDLKETRVSAESAAVYAEPNDIHRYAEALIAVLEDPRRHEMGKFGRARVEDTLAWSHQARHYVDVYDRLLGWTPPSPGSDGTADTAPAA